MRTRFTLAAIAAATLSTIAFAQMGQGMGPGGMQGRGMGPGMAGQQECPMGKGMGPGMMQRHGMGGGMKGGMAGGPGLAAIEALDLTDEQRAKITEIRRDVQRKNHALMASLREVNWKAQDASKGDLDVAASRKLYEEGAAVRKQMFEARLEARAKAEAVLTKEQRGQLRDAPKPGPMKHRMG